MKQLQRSFNSIWLKFSFDMLFRLARDPWNYMGSFEQWKYQQELQLLPSVPILQALELGCAEGIFTVQLAGRVGHLVAADISSIAVNRAAQRCVLQQCENVQVIEFDLTQDELLADQFDLIICSEILYYMGNQTILQEVAHKLAQALKPNGYLLTSNDYRVSLQSVQQSETVQQSGTSRKSRVFGAEVIGAALSETSLQLVKVIQTPFHCTHLFQRSSDLPNRSPEVVNLTAVEVPKPQMTVFDWFSIAAIVKAWRQ